MRCSIFQRKKKPAQQDSGFAKVSDDGSFYLDFNDRRTQKKVAQEFEEVFISQMLNHMFKGISTDGPFGGGSSEKIYRSMMVDQYGKQMAANGGIGLSDAIHTELLRLQEVSQ